MLKSKIRRSLDIIAVILLLVIAGFWVRSGMMIDDLLFHVGDSAGVYLTTGYGGGGVTATIISGKELPGWFERMSGHHSHWISDRKWFVFSQFAPYVPLYWKEEPDSAAPFPRHMIFIPFWVVMLVVSVYPFGRWLAAKKRDREKMEAEG